MKNSNHIMKPLEIILPFILVSFWFVAALFLNNKYSFTTLIYQYSKQQFINYPQGKLLKGEIIQGEIKSADNYLGMITIRFKDYVKHDYNEEDNINFRIKEKGTSSWYYSNNYKSGIIENSINFPFGFPAISNSKNKDYIFEITSLEGNDNNSIELDTDRPQLTAVHKYPKEVIIASSKSIVSFLFKKIVTSFTNIDFLLNSILFFIPLFVYFSRKGLFRIIKQLPVVILLFVCADIFLLKDVYIGLVLLLEIGWLISIFQYHIDSKSSFSVAFIFFMIWMPLMYLDTKYIQNKLNIWVYFFLLMGVLQAFLEEKYPNKKRTSIADIFKRIIT